MDSDADNPTKRGIAVGYIYVGFLLSIRYDHGSLVWKAGNSASHWRHLRNTNIEANG